MAALEKTDVPIPGGGGGAATDDSYPLNFDTFIPDHDPSLATVLPPFTPGVGAGIYPGARAPSTWLSRDEAFQRALDAMYWTGYWTAVYHVRSISR